MKIKKSDYKKASKIVSQNSTAISGLQLLLAGVSALGASMFIHESKAVYLFPNSLLLGIGFTCVLVVLIEFIDYLMSKLGVQMIFEKLIVISCLFVLPIWTINKALSVYSTLQGANYVAEGQITPPETTNKESVFSSTDKAKETLRSDLKASKENVTSLQNQISSLLNDNRSYYWSSYSKKLVMTKRKAEELQQLKKALERAEERLTNHQKEVSKELERIEKDKGQKLAYLEEQDKQANQRFIASKKKAKSGNWLLVIFIEAGKVACTLLMLIATIFKDENAELTKEELLDKVRMLTLKYGSVYGAKSKILRELGMSTTRTDELRSLQIEAGVLDPITGEYLN